MNWAWRKERKRSNERKGKNLGTGCNKERAGGRKRKGEVGEGEGWVIMGRATCLNRHAIGGWV